MMFADRKDAGRRLLAPLAEWRGRRAVVLALPRGGVPVATEIARGLEAGLDLLIVRKIGLPQQPELAMGAVVDMAEPTVVRNEQVIEAARVTEAQFDRVRDQEIAELTRRRQCYLAERRHLPLRDRIIIIVDDGLATGTTMIAALRAVRQQAPREVVVAVPVAAADSLQRVKSLADEVIAIAAPDDLGSIGAYYRDFRQLSDADVTEALAAFDSAGR
jgi:putative phosphoribosyl transferase